MTDMSQLSPQERRDYMAARATISRLDAAMRKRESEHRANSRAGRGMRWMELRAHRA